MSPRIFFLLLFSLLARPRAGDADSYRSGRQDFAVDLEDAVQAGAALLDVVQESDCRAACGALPRCDVAQTDGNLTCALIDCEHRGRFVCRFLRRPQFRIDVREEQYRKYLEGPPEKDEPAPPIAVPGRDQVVRPGATVTLNGIQSLALGDASITDYNWTLQSGNANVVMEKTPLSDQVLLSNLEAGRYLFRLTVTDSNRRSHAADVQVLVLDGHESARYCLSEAKTGPCRAAFPRWHYDADLQRCRQFVFGGCKGNLNNFLSEKECERACDGVTPISSELQRVALPAGKVCGFACGASQLSCDGDCCLDRSLECDGVAQCADRTDEEHCTRLNRTFSRLLDLDVDQRKARCAEPPQTGPCRASHARWYYDPLETRCRRFTYGGCYGNDNNFAEETQCDAACHGVTERDVFARGPFERFEERRDEESGSGTAAVAVILAVAIAAALAVLGYCFLKNRKKKREAAEARAARQVTSEQDTLVYNSTTKPL
ncbi:kunitz-type protease inhibitor 1-like [Corythoichthys intestinalis]|uniref:kunitz-type protease inhibitor 1-like n=1 Tax=Corythoichthys intestinalis TaxID=161448 RepID=UPI0025A5424D|nr:kunitz-type protease inhibitor 1-like [Corythoichthys intestinalis]XP_061806361.1 kunitz-type protease inhibitor 1-like [Nerophis lumbriciformis]